MNGSSPAKGLLLALALLCTGTVSAQDATPDTTDWRTYFPLEIGNAWQYRGPEQLPGGGLGTILRGWRVEGDTTVGGTDYVVLRSCYFEEGEPESCPDVHLIRYDLAHAMIVMRDPATGEDRWWQEIPCDLDAPFDAPKVECTGPGTEGAWFFTYGGYDRTVVVPPDMLQDVTLKAFSIGGFESYALAAGLGLASYNDELRPAPLELIYARVDGQEVGTSAFSFPTAAEPTPSTGTDDPAVAVVPNPAHGHTALVFRLPAPAAVTVAVFDPLGRRVRVLPPRALSAGEHRIAVDLGGLAPGVYLVRLSAGSRVADRTITVH